MHPPATLAMQTEPPLQLQLLNVQRWLQAHLHQLLGKADQARLQSRLLAASGTSAPTPWPQTSQAATPALLLLLPALLLLLPAPASWQLTRPNSCRVGTPMPLQPTEITSASPTRLTPQPGPQESAGGPVACSVGRVAAAVACGCGRVAPTWPGAPRRRDAAPRHEPSPAPTGGDPRRTRR